MKQIQIHIDRGTYKILYNQYKAYLLPIIIFAISILLVVFFIVPQIQSYFSQQDAVNDLRSKIRILQDNYTVLSQANDQDVDEKLQTAALALPPDKDFAGILQAVNNSAIKSNVTLGDFTFRVGELSSQSAQVATTPSIPMTLTVNGDIEKIKAFLATLSESSPLSQVVSVDLNGINAEIIINFFYKPFPPLVFRASQKVAQLSAQDQLLLQQLAKYKIGMTQPLGGTRSSSASATPF